MEMKFKFVGDPGRYLWDNPPVYDDVYNGGYKWTYRGEIGEPLEEWCTEESPENKDWEEVTEPTQTRIPNQDMPASSMTKFEMAVFMAMQGLMANPKIVKWDLGQFSEVAITHTKETFKQLNELK